MYQAQTFGDAFDFVPETFAVTPVMQALETAMIVQAHEEALGSRISEVGGTISLVAKYRIPMYWHHHRPS